MKIIAFFNNKGGVGKTTLVYHLAWMFTDLGFNVVVADLDPQSNLSSALLDEDRLENIWPEGVAHTKSILGVVEPILAGTGDIGMTHVENIADNLGLIVGDLGLSSFEDRLSTSWPLCMDGREAEFRVMSAFYRAVSSAASAREASLVLVDVGPNLGAINRAALIAADHVVVPLAPDLFSLQGLRNLGPTLFLWREQWQERLKKIPKNLILPMPNGKMRPAGYVAMQHAVRLDRPVKAYDRWMQRIPAVYQEFVLGKAAKNAPTQLKQDPHCLALLKHYRSLMPMSMESHKPMFFLKPADGAIGAHTHSVQECYKDFKKLAQGIVTACDIKI